MPSAVCLLQTFGNSRSQIHSPRLWSGDFNWFVFFSPFSFFIAQSINQSISNKHYTLHPSICPSSFYPLIPCTSFQQLLWDAEVLLGWGSSWVSYQCVIYMYYVLNWHAQLIQYNKCCTIFVMSFSKCTMRGQYFIPASINQWWHHLSPWTWRVCITNKKPELQSRLELDPF